MTNKLTLNEKIQTFLDADNKQVWDLILDNKTDELQALLPIEGEEILSPILHELFETGESKTLEAYDFTTLKPGLANLFGNMVRLIMTLHVIDGHENILRTVESKLTDFLPMLVDNIEQATDGHMVRRMVPDVIITAAANVRSLLISLSYCYRETGNIEALHFTTVMRTKISLSIMKNHKHILGYDMVETARIKEQVGEKDAALGFYNAARENLRNELHWFAESPEMGPSEDDTILLQSLKEAYLSIDRLNNTSEYNKVCSIIDEILSREYIEYDFDAEDDE